MAIKREDSTYDRKNAIYRPDVPRPLSPDQRFRSEGEKNTFPTVGEFWSWAYSDLKENTSRGVLAEFLVASALGIVGETKAGWEPYDLRTSSGTRVEVKASGYLQAWATMKHSNINFSSLKGRVYDSESGEYSNEPGFNADIYVFCKHTATTHDQYEVLNLDQWEFYVVPLKFLQQRNTKSITEVRLIKDGYTAVSFNELGEEFSKVEQEKAIPLWEPRSGKGWNESNIKNWLNTADSSWEIRNFKKLLDFSENHATQIGPTRGKRPGFAFRTLNSKNNRLVTLWAIRGSGLNRPLRLENCWTYIRDGINHLNNPDKIFQQFLSESNGRLGDIEIGGEWTVLAEMSPSDVDDFTKAVVGFLSVIKDTEI